MEEQKQLNWSDIPDAVMYTLWIIICMLFAYLYGLRENFSMDILTSFLPNFLAFMAVGLIPSAIIKFIVWIAKDDTKFINILIITQVIVSLMGYLGTAS